MISPSHYGDLNPHVNKTPPDPRLLEPGQKIEYGRKSTANEKKRAEKSLKDQRAYTEATSRAYNLPSTDDDWMEEPAGLSGTLWWEGVSNGLYETDAKTKTRPILTKIMRGVVNGEIRCVVVWNVDRLYRDVAICREMLKVMFDYGCLLFDANGPVNIWTYEGRNAILQNAIASQAVSEAARVNSPRGVQQNIREGKLVVSPNVQGFRSAGQKTGEVIHIESEQDLVNRIFAMADMGASPEDIGCTLMSEGVTLYESSGGKNPHGHKRHEDNLSRIYNGSIFDILRDCRYVGRQQHIPLRAREEAKKLGVPVDPRDHQYPCPAFLRPDSATVVPVDRWERVQKKLDLRRRTNNRAVNYRPLASLVRCGLDGESLNAQEIKQPDGSMVGFWIMRHTKIRGKGGECVCPHRVPTVRETVLDAYIADILCPLLVAEINERHGNTAADAYATQRAALGRELDKAVRWLDEGLVEFTSSGEVTPKMLGKLEAKAQADVERIRRELASLHAVGDGLPSLLPILTDLENASEGARRDAIRQTICWIAVFATPSVREPKPGYREDNEATTYTTTYAPRIVGTLVFLTSWGTCHSAILHRERHGDRSGYPPLKLRPADPAEAIGGVADFPDPERFLAGLKRAWAGRVYGWSPDKIAPGYSPHREVAVAEFDLDT